MNNALSVDVTGLEVKSPSYSSNVTDTLECELMQQVAFL